MGSRQVVGLLKHSGAGGELLSQQALFVLVQLYSLYQSFTVCSSPQQYFFLMAYQKSHFLPAPSNVSAVINLSLSPYKSSVSCTPIIAKFPWYKNEAGAFSVSPIDDHTVMISI
jgi:hypothetical protein